MNEKPVILLVEDSDEDYETIRRAFNQVNLGNTLIRSEDGDQALDYLFHRGRYENRDTSPRPSLILMDLNLPGTDGRAVLAQIKGNPDLRQIPVVVMTTSSDERDIAWSYAAGANSFIQKPVSFAGVVDAMKRVKDYWFDLVLFPKPKTQ
jgi:CheY-like chemotaxis protein